VELGLGSVIRDTWYARQPAQYINMSIRSTLVCQYVLPFRGVTIPTQDSVSVCFAVCYSVLQCVAVCLSVLHVLQSTQGMGSTVDCMLLEPCDRLRQALQSATAGSSSPGVLQVQSPRDQPHSYSLTSSPSPKTRARAEREQTMNARASSVYIWPVAEIT